MLGDKQENLSENFTFCDVRLPPVSSIPDLSYFSELPIILPAFQMPKELTDSVLKTKRGAPVKHKNALAKKYKLKNTQGTCFKFSFVLQILIAHMHHLFGLKGKSRYQSNRWLRKHKREGAGLLKSLQALVGDNAPLLQLKRPVSISTLRAWLKADGTANVSQLRQEVFRKFCILKLIDIENQYASDFNIISQKDYGWKPIKEYIMKILWEDLNFPPLSEEEVTHTINEV